MVNVPTIGPFGGTRKTRPSRTGRPGHGGDRGHRRAGASGASKGEGLGNQFLANIRETNAIIHVLRCFDNGNITHVDGTIDPVRDKEIIDTELAAQGPRNRREPLARSAKQATSGGDKKPSGRANCCSRYKAALEQGRSARTVELDKEDRKLVADLQLLTDKPVLYVCNVDERSAATGNAYVEAVRDAIARRRGRSAGRGGSDRSRHRRTGRPTTSGRCSWRRWDCRSRA
ncbi:hypothetical protein [Alistipes communis]|uniref:hypothetical protein n=1 Tax=Alistipes communis TaxID=2585118 RepID=UPI003C6C8A47